MIKWVLLFSLVTHSGQLLNHTEFFDTFQECNDRGIYLELVNINITRRKEAKLGWYCTEMKVKKQLEY